MSNIKMRIVIIKFQHTINASIYFDIDILYYGWGGSFRKFVRDTKNVTMTSWTKPLLTYVIR